MTTKYHETSLLKGKIIMGEMTTLDTVSSTLKVYPNGRFQYFQPLSDEEYEALKGDIERRGIQTPIEIDKKGTIIDGHHRYKVARELRIPEDEIPIIVRDDLKTDSQKTEFAIKSNLLRRRHVGPITWAKCTLELMKARGIDRSRNHNGSTESKDMVSSLMNELGVNERTARRHIKIYHDLKDHPEVAEQVDLGKMTVAEAMKEINKGKSETEKKTIDPEKAQDEYVNFFQAIMKYTKTLASQYEEGHLPYYTDPHSGDTLKENYLVIGLGVRPDEFATPEEQAVVGTVKQMTKKQGQKADPKNGKVPTA